MPASYNYAMNHLYKKLCGYSAVLSNLRDIDNYPSTYDNAVVINPLVKDIVKQVEESLSYEFSERQCSYAVRFFIIDKLITQ